MAKVIGSIATPEDVAQIRKSIESVMSVCSSFPEALAVLEKLTDQPADVVEEKVRAVVTFVGSHRREFEKFADRQLLISAIAAFDFPQYPEELQRTVNAFLFTLKN